MTAWLHFENVDVPRVVDMVAAIVGLWWITGESTLRGILKSGDARKINHIYAFVGLAFCFGWLPSSVARASAFAVGVVLVTLAIFSCLRAERWPWRVFVAANSRVEDQPHACLLYWSSWALSFAALLAVDAWLNDIRVVRLVGMIVGLGDGLAEPVGKRWGRHRYAALGWPKGQFSRKSLEGSLAVFLGAVAGVYICEGPELQQWLTFAAAATLVGVAAAVVEALSPRGLDNVTLPFALALLVGPLFP